jgi:hypothetical protein
VTDLLTTLVPLAIVGAVTPVQITILVLLLQSAGGMPRATAWVAGMTLVRLAQGILFGLVLGVGVQEDPADSGPGPVALAILLLVGIFFLVSAIRKLLRQPDEDAPPPRWMAAVEGARPRQAFLMGLGYVGLSPKLWAFTLAAIAAIEGAGLAPATTILVFLGYVAAAQSTHLVALALTALAPTRAIALMGSVAALLQRWDRAIMVTLGLAFGAFLVVKALIALGDL